MIEWNLKIFYLTCCNVLQQEYNLFFHLFLIHNKHILSTSLFSSSLDHIEWNPVSDANHVSGGDILIIHSLYDFNNLLSIWYLAVSQNYYMSLIILLHFTFGFCNVQKRFCNFCSPKIGIEFLNFSNGLFQNLIAVPLTIFV